MTESGNLVRFIEPKRFPKKYLSRGEQVFVETRYHWSTWGWWEITKSFLFALVALATYDGVPSVFGRIQGLNPSLDEVLEFLTEQPMYLITYVSVVIVFLSLHYSQWRLLHCTVYVLTNQRVIKYRHTSTLKREIQDIPLKYIEEVRLEQKLRSRWLGYGTLTFSKGEDRFALQWVAVPRPLEVRDRIVSAIWPQGALGKN